MSKVTKFARPRRGSYDKAAAEQAALRERERCARIVLTVVDAGAPLALAEKMIKAGTPLNKVERAIEAATGRNVVPHPAASPMTEEA